MASKIPSMGKSKAPAPKAFIQQPRGRSKLQPSSKPPSVPLPKSRLFKATYDPLYRGRMLRNSFVLSRPVPMAKLDVLDRLREQKGLWWKVLVSTGQRPVVRGWLNRRVNEAWIQALRDRGLDEQGVGIDKTTSGRKELRGSLLIRVQNAAALAATAQLTDDVNALADALTKRIVTDDGPRGRQS